MSKTATYEVIVTCQRYLNSTPRQFRLYCVGAFIECLVLGEVPVPCSGIPAKFGAITRVEWKPA